MQKKNWYQSFSLFVSNTFLLIFILNLFVGGLLWLKNQKVRQSQNATHKLKTATRVGQPQSTAKRDSYQLHWVDTRSYEGIEDPFINQILDDFSDFQKKGQIFVPYLQIAPPPFSSRTLNVVAENYEFSHRTNGSQDQNNGQSLPDFTVFFFGGSTSFGWNVADGQTIPSQLEKILQSRDPKRHYKVLNFGRGYYSWQQELLLWIRLLESGKKADAVVFLDGVNWGHRIPPSSEKLKIFWEKDQSGFSLENYPTFVPIFDLANRIRNKIAEKKFKDYLNSRYPQSELDSSPLNSYLSTNKMIRALGRANETPTYLFWQPHRAYHCQTEKYSQALPSDFIQGTVRLYTEITQLNSKPFTDLSHLCETELQDHRLFVDDVHYSPFFNQSIAKSIADAIKVEAQNGGPVL